MSPRRPALARRGRGRPSPRARGSASPPHRHAERDGGVPLVGERDEQALDTQYVRTRLRGAGEHDPRGAARRPRHAYVLPPPAAHAPPADDVRGGSVAGAAAGSPAPALVPRSPSTKSTTTRAPPAASHGH